MLIPLQHNHRLSSLNDTYIQTPTNSYISSHTHFLSHRNRDSHLPEYSRGLAPVLELGMFKIAATVLKNKDTIELRGREIVCRCAWVSALESKLDRKSYMELEKYASSDVRKRTGNKNKNRHEPGRSFSDPFSSSHLSHSCRSRSGYVPQHTATLCEQQTLLELRDFDFNAKAKILTSRRQ